MVRHFTVYVKKGKGVSELGKFSTRTGTPGSIARKGATSACSKSRAKTCNRTILVREHNTSRVKEYKGVVRRLAKPVNVKISGKNVSFKTKSKVTYVKTVHV